MGDIIVYEFCGDDGCDTCSSFTGFSINEKPERPHPNCECDIYECTAEEISDGEYEIEEENFDRDTDWTEIEYYYDNCNNNDPCHIEFHLEEDAELCTDCMVDENLLLDPAVDMMNDIFEFDIPPHSSGTVRILKEREIIQWLGNVYHTCEIGDETIRHIICFVSGKYEHNYNITGEVDFEPCD